MTEYSADVTCSFMSFSPKTRNCERKTKFIFVHFFSEGDRIDFERVMNAKNYICIYVVNIKSFSLIMHFIVIKMSR